MPCCSLLGEPRTREEPAWPTPPPETEHSNLPSQPVQLAWGEKGREGDWTIPLTKYPLRQRPSIPCHHPRKETLQSCGAR